MSLSAAREMRFYHAMTINPRSFIRDHFSTNHVVPEAPLSRRDSGVSFEKPARVFSPGALKRRRRSDSHQLPIVVGVMGSWLAD